MLETAAGEELHPDANAKERHPVDHHPLLQRLDQIGYGVEAFRTGFEGAHARQHHAPRAAHDRRIGRNRDPLRPCG